MYTYGALSVLFPHTRAYFIRVSPLRAARRLFGLLIHHLSLKETPHRRLMRQNETD